VSRRTGWLLKPRYRMGPPPRSFAIDAQYCIMVRVKKTPGYKLAARTYAPGSGLHSDHLRNRLTAGESASVLAAVKDKPAVAAEDAAILDHRCARRRERNAVGAEECSRRGSNKRMDYKDHVSPLTR